MDTKIWTPKCVFFSDGAESCPDTTKVTFLYLGMVGSNVVLQGGGKNVEMLNSVSRDNYTMLTFRCKLNDSLFLKLSSLVIYRPPNELLRCPDLLPTLGDLSQPRTSTTQPS